ncbi:MAG: DUF481 domain-containing protein [Bacteroidota bacterium]
MRKCLVLLFCIGFIQTLQGQILKLDRRSVLHDTSQVWLGNADFKLNVNNNNATVDNSLVFVGFHGGTDVNYVSEKHVYSLINSLNYFTTGAGPFVSTGYAHFRVNWGRKKKLSYENFAQIQYDRGRNLQRRTLTGGGIRLNFHQSKKSYLHVGIGGMYESETWKRSDEGLSTVNVFKSTSYLGAIVDFNKHLNISFIGYFQTGYYQPFQQWLSRVSGDLNINVEITKRLQYVTSFRLQYESRPIIPINKVVYALTNGVSLRFG